MNKKNLSPKDQLILFLKGLCMGTADVIPGVSGGTIALISGIYDELLSSIKNLHPGLLGLIFKKKFKAFWLAINAPFLFPLGVGIAASIISFAKVITHLLKEHPQFIWSFFFGLILASSFYLHKQIKGWDILRTIFFATGTLAGYAVTALSPTSGHETVFYIFISGVISICAMILPGISGSFILLLLGMYQFIIESLISIRLQVILIFSGGCVFGLLSFSHILSWLLSKYRRLTLSFLTGLMLGSLNKVWPWKQTLKSITNRHGELVPVVEKNILPSTFHQVTGQDSFWLSCLMVCLLGGCLVFILDFFGRKYSANS